MDEQDFSLLSVLGRTRNITHAANELYITQSSVSKRIRQMERQLNTTLFLRSKHGIEFTPSGEIVLRHVEQIQQELTAIRQELAAIGDSIAGTLRLGVSTNYALFRFPSQLEEYQDRYPAVALQVTTANSQKLYSMLVSNQIDVGILRGEHSDWHGERILLEREPICIITSEQDADKSLHDLTQIHRKTDADMEHAITQWMQENKIRPKKHRINVNSTATCTAMVERGLGWGIVPGICLQSFHGTARPMVFKDGEPLLRSTYIMYSPEALELPQAQAFIHLIRDFFPENPEDKERFFPHG